MIGPSLRARRARRSASAAAVGMLAASLLVLVAPQAGASTPVFTQPANIAIPAAGTGGCPASAPESAPYPSTISVAAGGGTLDDVNVSIDLRHTFSADLDILLVGPTGATAVLMEDRGGSAGLDAPSTTLTFDTSAVQALPTGSVAFASGSYIPGPGVSSCYTAPAPAGPYGSLDDFNGTSPNGTWSLFVIDDAGIDIGTIFEWRLELAINEPTAQNPDTTTLTKGPDITIPDGAPGTTAGPADPYPSTLNVPFCATVTDLNASITLSHTFPSDVEILLVAPSGARSVLMEDQGGGTDVVGVELTFDNSATVAVPSPIVSGTYLPSPGSATYPPPAPAGPHPASMANFNGTDAQGDWNLFVNDDAAADVGLISEWSIEVTFIPCDSGSPHDLEVIVVGTGTGTVTSTPAGINCPPDCTETPSPAVVAAGGVYLLQANPAPGSVFTGWSGACSDGGICTVTVGRDVDVFVAAWFDVSSGPAPAPDPVPLPSIRYDLRASVVGGGSIVSDPAGIDCGTTCTAIVDAGTAVKVTATPDAGWMFARWKYGCAGSGETCTIEMGSNRRARAVFVRV